MKKKLSYFVVLALATAFSFGCSTVDSLRAAGDEPLLFAFSEDTLYTFRLQQKQDLGTDGYCVYCEKWRWDRENRKFAASQPEWSTPIDTVKTRAQSVWMPYGKDYINREYLIKGNRVLFFSHSSYPDGRVINQYVVDVDGHFLYKWAGYSWASIECSGDNYYVISKSIDGDRYMFYFKAQELRWIEYLRRKLDWDGSEHYYIDDKVLYISESNKLVHEDIYSGEHLFEVELKLNGEAKPAKDGDSIFFSFKKIEQSGDSVFVYYDEYEKIAYDKIDQLTGTVIGQDYKDEYRNTYCYKLSYPEGEILDWFKVTR